MRHLHRRRRQPRHRTQSVENLLQRQVFPTEDVPFTEAPTLQRRQMHPRNLIHIDKIQPRIDIRRKLLIQKVDDDPSRRRRLHIHRAHRRRRIQNHDLLPRARRLNRHLLGHPLRALVVPDHVRLAHRRLFIHDRRILAKSHRRHARCVHHAPHARLTRQPQQLPRALDIRLVHLRRIRHPQPVIRGHMNQRIAPSQRRSKLRRLAQISLHQLRTLRQDFQSLKLHRVSSRSSAPCSAAIRATCDPTNPVAPVTNNLISDLSRNRPPTNAEGLPRRQPHPASPS